LRLTSACLAAFTKYPCESLITIRDKNRKSQKKYGFFQAEREVFSELAAQVGLNNFSQNNDLTWSRHPLAFLVEAADDICYGIIDFEDGCRLGLVSYEQTVQLFAEIIGDQYDAEKLNRINGNDERIGVLRALAINALVEQVSNAFLQHESDILSGEFDSALTDQIPASETLNKISALSIEKIYRSTQVVEREAAGYRIIDGLLEAFCDPAIRMVFDKAIFQTSTGV